jgi:hypothetical protein
MRLSRHSDYAFRMLMHAALSAPELITVNDVARAFHLSAAHLQKVAQPLADISPLFAAGPAVCCSPNLQSASAWAMSPPFPNRISTSRPAWRRAEKPAPFMNPASCAPPFPALLRLFSRN